MKIYKYVGGLDLEQHTLNGWTLDQIVVAQTLEQRSLKTAPPSHEPYRCDYRDEAFVVSAPMFVLWKDSDAVSAEAALAADLHELRREQYELRDLAKGLTSDVQQLTVQARLNEESRAAALRLRDIAQEKLRTLECDLAKVRVAIGTKAYDEAVK